MLSGKLRIQPFRAFRTDAVRKLRFGMLPYIGFDVFPIALVVADVFARGADRQKAAELFDGRQRRRQFTVEVLLALKLCLNIPESHGYDHESHESYKRIPILAHPNSIDMFIKKMIHNKPYGGCDKQKATAHFFI